MNDKPTFEELETQVNELMRGKFGLDTKDDALNAFFDQSLVMLFIADMKTNTLVRVNDEVVRVTGRSREDLISMSFMNFIHPDDRDSIMEVMAQLAEGKSLVGYQNRLLTADGHIRFFEWNAVPDLKRNLVYAMANDITKHNQTVLELEKKSHDLGERIKELNCLYNISKLIEKSDISLDAMLQEIVNFIPPSYQYPESTCARLLFRAKEYKTDNFVETEWLLESKISIFGNQTVQLSIYYLTELPNEFEGPFLREERNLIDAIIMQVGRIIEQRRSERALRQSEEQYRQLVESANSIILRLDKDGKIIFFNKFAQDFFGYTEEEIIGKSSIGTILPEIESTGRNLKKLFMDIRTHPDKYHSSENENIKKTGDRVWVSWTNKAIKDQSGKVVEILSIGTDITDKKEFEKRLRQAQKMESIGNLAGGIAHDFNNILSSVIGFTEIALDEVEESTTIEDSLQEVYAAGKRAKDLVKQILAFARQSEVEVKPLQPSSIAEEVLKFIRSTIPSTIDIEKHIESDSFIMGNATQFHQILMNLCTNATHAMEDAGGILEVSMQDIIINNAKDNMKFPLKSGDYIQIKISDTGRGIETEILSSIFDPYFTTKPTGEGTGMGLAVVHGIIEAYGGHINVKSRLEQGTTFTIFLPLVRNGKTSQQNELKQLPRGTERILLVDDEAPIAKMGSQNLESLGYRVTTRTSSVEALELFKSKPYEFDLVLSDMTMPNMTGDILSAELLQVRPNIPIILCTGYSKKISKKMAANIGVKAFVYKPIVKADLAKTIRMVLDEAKS